MALHVGDLHSDLRDPTCLTPMTAHRQDREQGASSSTERPGHITPDIYAAQSATSSRGPPERENQGTVAERQPEIPAERASERDQVVEDVHDPVQLGRPKGKCRSFAR